ncbi:TrkA-N domain protein [uncultured delta proteobacterium]|uniref:TrkA-N domain protein n=1 Tax=uncultured delta proteobacterium TaxID=34034 RepID=A0A212JPH9_9DELT|nr:TrkA-N domain protein [uncultured delta proteobacterium]
MRAKLEVGVVGLGKFGLQFGSTLAELGHKVIGVDQDPERVRAARETLSQVYEANAADKTALTQLRFQDLDVVAVAVGDSMETSILVTLNVQELGIRDIIVKAVSPAHVKVLQRLGVKKVVHPEVDVAILTAYRLHSPGILDFLPIGSGVLVQELVVEAWEGKTLVDLNVRDTYGVLIAAVQGRGETEYRFVPNPRKQFAKGDKLLVIGRQQDVAALKP